MFLGEWATLGRAHRRTSQQTVVHLVSSLLAEVAVFMRQICQTFVRLFSIWGGELVAVSMWICAPGVTALTSLRLCLCSGGVCRSLLPAFLICT